ncbi:hypothetical protein M407DRAFT_243279, partial [Tulasnella calospora MUT 4182]
IASQRSPPTERSANSTCMEHQTASSLPTPSTTHGSPIPNKHWPALRRVPRTCTGLWLDR